MPLVGTRVHGEDWADHHRPVVSQTLTGTCEIFEPGGTPGDFNEETGERDVEPHPPHFSGACSVAVDAGYSEAVAGSQELTSVTYRVRLEFDAAPDVEIGHLVKLLSVGRNGDPTLTGRTLLVRAFERGTTVWERDLICTDDLG